MNNNSAAAERYKNFLDTDELWYDEPERPVDLLRQILAGELIAASDPVGSSEHSEAEEAVNLFLELIKNKRSDVAGEFLVVMVRKNFLVADKLSTQLQSVIRPRGRGFVSDDTILTDYEEFHSAELSHLKAGARWSQIGKKYGVKGETVRRRTGKRAPELVKFQKQRIDHQNLQLYGFDFEPEGDPTSMFRSLPSR